MKFGLKVVKHVTNVIYAILIWASLVSASLVNSSYEWRRTGGAPRQDDLLRVEGATGEPGREGTPGLQPHHRGATPYIRKYLIGGTAL